MQQQFLRSTRIKRKISSMHMPVIEAFDKNNKVLVDTMDQINIS
jgi:hypothetical protein